MYKVALRPMGLKAVVGIVQTLISHEMEVILPGV